MNELVKDIKSAFYELIGKSKTEAQMASIYERSKYDTYCVMAVDMRQNGHTIKEIADRLEVSKSEVKDMLVYKSVSEVNRTGGSRYE